MPCGGEAYTWLLPLNDCSIGELKYRGYTIPSPSTLMERPFCVCERVHLSVCKLVCMCGLCICACIFCGKPGPWLLHCGCG